MEQVKLCIIKKMTEEQIAKAYEKEQKYGEFLKWQIEEFTEDEWFEIKWPTEDRVIYYK